eukprot:m.758 g.758  ORF g.758 m.758 type:complete len:867 (-) comp306_c0_seq1:90-2690(-)
MAPRSLVVAAVCVLLGLRPVFGVEEDEGRCGGFGEADDWLVVPCKVPTTLTTSPADAGGSKGGMLNVTLANGILRRTLTVDQNSGEAYVTSLYGISARAEQLASADPMPEAFFDVVVVRAGADDGTDTTSTVTASSTGNTTVWVGGTDAMLPEGDVRMSFSSYHEAPVVKRYDYTPGSRASRHVPWPPAGTGAAFVYTLPCSQLGVSCDNNDKRGSGGDGTMLTVTSHVEMYQGTAAFGKWLTVQHNCTGVALSLANMYIDVSNTKSFQTSVDPGIAGVHIKPVAGGHHSAETVAFVSQSGNDDRMTTLGPGITLPSSATAQTATATTPQHTRAALANTAIPATTFTSFYFVKTLHTAPRPTEAPGGQRGMTRYGREYAQTVRLIAPQTAQSPVIVQAICQGGQDFADDDGRKGYWCYDKTGQQALANLIKQAGEVGVDVVVVGQNMNATWRSMIGNEMQSSANMTMFKGMVDLAKSLGMELGAYQLVKNARSASALNQAAPGDAASLPLDGYDCMDLLPPLGVGKACHNHGRADCKGGPGCCTLCTANAFYDSLEASMLKFWDITGMTVVDQDGAESGQPCANASHIHHHGIADSVWAQWQRMRQTFHSYLERDGLVIGMPGSFFEWGQSKDPGGYSEMTYSLPRWQWIDSQRQHMIADFHANNDLFRPNCMRFYPTPFTAYHPSELGPGGKFKQVVGYTSSATLEPLDDHLLELEWALSQTFGTGIASQLRVFRMYQGAASKAVVMKWISWYKRYRQTLAADFSTLQFSNKTSWDGVLHVTSAAAYPDVHERGVAVLWNTLNTSLVANVSLPMYYAGLAADESCTVHINNVSSTNVRLDTNHTAHLNVTLGPKQVTYLIIEKAS